ncbi:MAG: endo-1,3-1,4-beta glucanase-related protein [Saprospiraceae bacterium]|nr:MAG: endo-1,3-1,4-beta glucanase-related protein [Saprospiraceae bacterium]GIV31979.1 MAG: endo-1,3-1,4-beta glucanase-related protein [Saprospiraceae bacterium]
MQRLYAQLFSFAIALLFLQCATQAQIAPEEHSRKWPPEMTEVWEPVPRVVTPGVGTAPPSDAIVLFDGTHTNEWRHKDGSPVRWKLEDGVLTVVGGTGDIFTQRSFGDCQLHIEWRTPAEVKGEGQGRGNSGVFLQSRYEVQVLDSYNNRTYSNGQAASIYKQYMPLVNACRPPGEWQTYDIIFNAPRFNADGIRISPGYVTVIHNGVLVQNHVPLHGTTEYRGLPQNVAHGPAPLQLQDHGNPVSFRNIWIREL